MRALVEALSRLIVRIFFRRIEILGQENFPASGPVILALNHPNGLVDPLCILASSPRRISFLAKEPLFRTPLIKYFVKALECLPVYRRQDGGDMRQNLETLRAARELLARGGVIALFPEGISHDQPQLQSLKTGAARIALGAQALLAAETQSAAVVKLLPAGLYYSSKGIFRSEVALVYGAPLDVEVAGLDAESNPPRTTVKRLTRDLAAGLRALTVNARDNELITLAATAARLINDHGGSGRGSHALELRLNLMQQILAGHESLLREDPALAHELVERLRRYQSLINAHGLERSGTLRPDPGPAIRHVARTLLGLVILAPLIIPGLVINCAPYQLVGRLARRITGDSEDILSSIKVLAGMVLFPLCWIVVSLILWGLGDTRLAAVQLLLAPLQAWAALWLLERAVSTVAGTRILWLYWVRPDRFTELHREGQAIVEQMLGLSTR